MLGLTALARGRRRPRRGAARPARAGGSPRRATAGRTPAAAPRSTSRSVSIGIALSAEPSATTTPRRSPAHGRSATPERRAPAADDPDREHDRQRLHHLHRAGDDWPSRNSRTPSLSGSATPPTRSNYRSRARIVRAGERPRVVRERVARAVHETGHALQHRGERTLRGGEAHEHRPVIGDRGAVGQLRAGRSVAEGVAGPCSRVRSARLSSSLRLSSFVRPITGSCSATGSASHSAASWSTTSAVQQVAPPAPGSPSGPARSRAPRRRRRFCGAVDEPRQVEVVPVGPARDLLAHGGDVAERRDRCPRDVEDDVVRAP